MRRTDAAIQDEGQKAVIVRRKPLVERPRATRANARKRRSGRAAEAVRASEDRCKIGGTGSGPTRYGITSATSGSSATLSETFHRTRCNGAALTKPQAFARARRRATLVYIPFRGYSAKTTPPHADESRRSVNFELSIAMKRDIERIPARTEARIAGDGPPVLRLNGALDERATDEIVSAVLRTVDEHGHAILIEMERVTNDDPACLYELAKHVMGLRGDGIDVQVFVHEADLHARMAAIDDARDWLMERANTDASSPRKAIHLDGPR